MPFSKRKSGLSVKAPARLRRIVPALLDWFQAHARDLPWRCTNDPYAIWISEIMLQQTQVATVLPYYERWMQEVPSVQALAGLPEERLLKLWEGLGYYARARNLRKAALQILEKHDGVFPRNYEEVLALAGIGPYTAGAVCSIAFDQPVPAVDGNVARVLSRVFMLHGDLKASGASEKLFALAGELAKCAAGLKRCAKPVDRPCGKLTESLMELGALVCAPSVPDCPSCPLGALCGARQHNAVSRFPAKRSRPAATRHRLAVFVVTDGDGVLLRQRPASGPNAGFWELPSVEITGQRGERRLLAQAVPGLAVSRVTTLGTGSHAIMNRRVAFQSYLARVRRLDRVKDFKKCPRSSLEKLPLSTMTRKVLKGATHDGRPPF